MSGARVTRMAPRWPFSAAPYSVPRPHFLWPIILLTHASLAMPGMAVAAGAEMSLATTPEVSPRTGATAAPTDLPRPPLRLRLDRQFSPPPPYEDQYLDSDSADFLAGDASDASDRSAQGRRRFSADLRRARSTPRSRGAVTEQAVQLSGSRETLSWGTWHLDAGYADRRAEARGFLLFADEASEGYRFTLLQDAVPMADGWQLRQSLGDLRTRVPELLASSSRVNLPSSIVRGYSAELERGDERFQVNVGQLARFEGFEGASVNVRDGWLAGVGWQTTLSPTWSQAVSLGTLRDSRELGDRNSLAVSFGYRPLSGASDYRFNWLQVDDDTGLWISGQRSGTHWQQDFGVYRLPPGLTWFDGFVGDDRQGLHWRGFLRQPRWTLNLAAEGLESNIEGQADRSGRRLLAGLGSLTTRVRAHVTAGMSLRSRWQTAARGEPVPTGGSQGLSVFTTVGNRLGQTRLQLSREEESDSLGGERLWSLIWDQSWPGLGAGSLNTTAALEEQTLAGERILRLSGGVNARARIGGRLQLSASFGVSEINRSLAEQDAGLTSRSRNAQISATLPIGPEWRLAASYLRSDFRSSEQVRLGIPPDEDRRVMLNLSYATQWGRPAQVIGRPADGGVGGLSGEVFVDQTGDGERQPGEPGVANVPIFLDGIEVARTDEDGRFELWPVYSGSHQLRIAAEDLPLPLTPAFRGAITVEVPVRSYGYVAIPVVDLQP